MELRRQHQRSSTASFTNELAMIHGFETSTPPPPAAPGSGSLLDFLHSDHSHMEPKPPKRSAGKGKRKLPTLPPLPTPSSSSGSRSLQNSPLSSGFGSESEQKGEPEPTNTTKRSRYLREADRRAIIHRIENGEKQSVLAKEYGVTRAAICHINKNRVEILTRSVRADVHSAARHPKRGLYNTSKCKRQEVVEGYSDLPIVYEVRSHAMSILLTTLRRQETTGRDFRHCADRVFRLLLEEALASVPTQQIEISTPTNLMSTGIVVESQTCALSISDGGFAMLEVFRQLQPDSPTGFITLDAATSSNKTAFQLRTMCVPIEAQRFNVFVLDTTSTTGQRACVAMRTLVDAGTPEASIYYVALLMSALSVSEICNQFPKARIVTCAIDPDVSDVQGISPGLGNFLERYFTTA